MHQGGSGLRVLSNSRKSRVLPAVLCLGVIGSFLLASDVNAAQSVIYADVGPEYLKVNNDAEWIGRGEAGWGWSFAIGRQPSTSEEDRRPRAGFGVAGWIENKYFGDLDKLVELFRSFGGEEPVNIPFNEFLDFTREPGLRLWGEASWRVTPQPFSQPESDFQPPGVTIDTRPLVIGPGNTLMRQGQHAFIRGEVLLYSIKDAGEQSSSVSEAYLYAGYATIAEKVAFMIYAGGGRNTAIDNVFSSATSRYRIGGRFEVPNLKKIWDDRIGIGAALVFQVDRSLDDQAPLKVPSALAASAEPLDETAFRASAIIRWGGR